MGEVFDPAMAKRIEFRPVADLVAYDKNARTHSDEQVEQIAASISEFGFNNPILIDTDQGVIAGHGRLQAAKVLGLDEVPVVVLDHLSEQQRRAYILADNRLALNAGWDDELLAAELADLLAEGFDVDLLGFSEQEMADVIGETMVDVAGYSRTVSTGSPGNGADLPPWEGADDLGPVAPPMPAAGPAVSPVVSGPGFCWDLSGLKLAVDEGDERQADRLVIHWQKETGGAAVLCDDGRTFAELEADLRAQTGGEVF